MDRWLEALLSMAQSQPNASGITHTPDSGLMLGRAVKDAMGQQMSSGEASAMEDRLAKNPLAQRALGNRPSQFLGVMSPPQRPQGYGARGMQIRNPESRGYPMGSAPTEQYWAPADSQAGVGSWREALNGPGGYMAWLQREMPGAYAGPPAAGWGGNISSLRPEDYAHTGNTVQTTGQDYWTKSPRFRNAEYTPTDVDYAPAPENYRERTVVNSPDLRSLRNDLLRAQSYWPRRNDSGYW